MVSEDGLYGIVSGGLNGRIRLRWGQGALVAVLWLLAGYAGAADVSADSMVLIPAGTFVMGSNKVDTAERGVEFGNAKPWYVDEHPQHEVRLKGYYIDRYEVTNAQYREFVARNGHAPPRYWMDNGYVLSLREADLARLDVERLRALASQVFKVDADTRAMDKAALVAVIEKRLVYMDKLPIVAVTWGDAEAYCASVDKHLPTEAEWEKAARGDKGSEFPWGDEWLAEASNVGVESWDDGVAPVGSYPKDKSPYGVMDMAGNVSEWVADWYRPYPGSQTKSKDFGQQYRVVRGAAWGREGHYALHLFQRGAYRFYQRPDSALMDVGFRCAMDAARPSFAK